MLVVLFATPLWYANAVHFREQLTRRARRARSGRPRLVVLDALGMTDLDFTGSRALAAGARRARRPPRRVRGRAAGQHVRDSLARSGLLERIGEDRFFPSVDEAVSGGLR